MAKYGPGRRWTPDLQPRAERVTVSRGTASPGRPRCRGLGPHRRPGTSSATGEERHPGRRSTSNAYLGHVLRLGLVIDKVMEALPHFLIGLFQHVRRPVHGIENGRSAWGRQEQSGRPRPAPDHSRDREAAASNAPDYDEGCLAPQMVTTKAEVGPNWSSPRQRVRTFTPSISVPHNGSRLSAKARGARCRQRMKARHRAFPQSTGTRRARCDPTGLRPRQ